MAKPEQQVIDYFRRRLKKYAAQYGFTLEIDKPPSSAFNSNGRPDLFIDLGPYHFRCEMKAEGKKMTKLQELYFQKREKSMPHTCHCIAGKAEVDEWMDNLPNLLRAYRTWVHTIL